MSINVNQLTKIYGEQKAVNNLSFEIKKGEIVGFLGPNGAGKSTTMKILTTYITPTSGQAHVCGYDVTQAPQDVKKLVGYLPESNPLYYDMYVREYLEYVAKIHHITNVKSQVNNVIEKVGLTKEAHKKIGALSKGYKQRTGIAQAIIHEPEVLILDEPTSGLDPLQLDEIRHLITTIGQDKTVMLSTHIMQEVEAMCQRVMIINNGQLVKDYPLTDNTSHVTQEDQNQVKTLHISLQHPIQMDITSLWGQDINVQAHPTLSNQYYISSHNISQLKKNIMRYSLEHENEILFMKEYVESLEEIFKKATK